MMKMRQIYDQNDSKTAHNTSDTNDTHHLIRSCSRAKVAFDERNVCSTFYPQSYRPSHNGGPPRE
jgi:hypothetical protein